MPEKSQNEVPRDLRELYQKGNTALVRQNFEYAVAIFTQVLQREPGFFECRQALRAAQFKKAGGGGGGFFKKMLGGASSQPLVAKAQMNLRKNPLEAIQIAEEVLAKDPDNTGAHKVIAEAALEADLPKTACLSLEIALKNNPRDYDLSMQYGEALARAGQVPKAEQVYAELLKYYPHKGEVATALKNVSAKRTMSEGGYDSLADGTGSYRDILKDKDEAVQLEQEQRAVKSEDVAERLIREYEQRLVSEPNNLKLLRNIAELLTQKKDFDRALEYYERIRSVESGDPSLERAIAETQVRRFDHLMGHLDQAAPDYAEQLARLQKEKDEFELSECQKRVEKYPTDLQIRFDLGQLYLKNKRYTEAIQEFQKAQANPARRVQAMGALAQCFTARGMNDLAARKIQEALKEKPSFDDEKKELIYQLGCVLEKMGKKEEAIEQFKQIYEADIGYKDVAAKVDAYYASQG
jgi:tetratricopeptide (TPR) repeat protein